MGGLLPVGSDNGSRQNLSGGPATGVSEFRDHGAANAVPGPRKRKRRPAGTPDPGAEVVFLSPKTLMESDRYICEICNQGFQRDQNLQMHRRRHKIPWKLSKKPTVGTPKRVYVCPERSCLHHNPAHALGDLVGIKKHYRRKHCTDKQWKCDRCCKRYAVQSDFKAHLKTCGTRGHCCDCGRVFSRVESFIEHQDICHALKPTSMQQSDGALSERKQPPGFQLSFTDRNSLNSPSQSSEAAQAFPFAQSGMPDRSTGSTRVPVADDHRYHFSGRIALAAQHTLPTSAACNALPAWMTDRRCRELEISKLPVNSTLQKPMTSEGQGSTFAVEESMPSLQLSLGLLADTKPSQCASVEEEASGLACQHGGSRFLKSSRPSLGDVVAVEILSDLPPLGNDLVLSSQNQEMDGPGEDAVKLVTDSRVHAGSPGWTSCKAVPSVRGTAV